MANKMLTSDNKGTIIQLMGIFMSFMPITILMGAIARAICFNGHYGYKNATLMPIICSTKC